jgi:hypothetical protein
MQKSCVKAVNTILLVIALSSTSIGCIAQAPAMAAPYAENLPYGFGNFVWWNNDELRGLLKTRIPGLGDEIAPHSPIEHKIHDALIELLKEKGIAAEVQSIEPAQFTFSAERAPDSPPPAIIYSLLSPSIRVDHVVVLGAPQEVADSLDNKLKTREGHDYSSVGDWLVRSNSKDELAAKGYLDPQIEISHDAPRRNGDYFLVNLLVNITSGPQFRIEQITADGGPLLKGRDLSSLLTGRPGDIANGYGPFGRIAGEIRAYYWHFGYASVQTQGEPVLDLPNAKVSYHLQVIPGPLYHLRSLTVQNLAPEQEGRVRELLGMKAGDIYDGMAVNGLYQKLSSDPLLKSEGFSFSPATDKAAAQVDLKLDFYKQSDKSSVTAR